MIDFYTNPRSRGAIVRWMLEEAGASYRQQIIGYGEEMKAPGYLAINPMGKVPAIIHNGQVVTECAAICAYLADSFPEAGLAPTVAERASYYRWMFFAAGPLEAAISNRAAKADIPPQMEMMMGYGTYDKTVDTLEMAVTGHSYLCGERFTAADVYVGAQIIWGLQFGTLPDRSGFIAYRDRLVMRPAYVKASTIDADLAEAST